MSDVNCMACLADNALCAPLMDSVYDTGIGIGMQSRVTHLAVRSCLTGNVYAWCNDEKCFWFEKAPCPL